MASRVEIAPMVLTYCSIYEKPVPTDTVLDAWFSVLKNVPIEFIAQAGEDLLKTSKWMPRPAEVFEAASILWRKALTEQERRERLRIGYDANGKEPMTRQQLHEMMVDMGYRLGTWEEFQKTETKREANIRRAEEAAV